MELWSHIESFFLDPPLSETDIERHKRLASEEKICCIAKSQRNTLLQDLESSIHCLLQHIQTVTSRAVSTDARNASAVMESTDDAQKILLNDSISLVTSVCDSIDRCLSHNLCFAEKHSTSTVKFFGLVKWTCTRVQTLGQAAKSELSTNSQPIPPSKWIQLTLQSEVPRHIRGLFAVVRVVSTLSNVNSDEGKARAFIRQALNMHLLQDFMSLVLAENNFDLLASYYTENALFRQRDDVKMFLSLLTQLTSLSFTFLINDSRLDISPNTFPFSKALPPPKIAKVKKPQTNLIDPHDMVTNRVWLCGHDSNTEIVAEKLISHHHLRAAFNSHKGGNYLSNVVRETQRSHHYNDAATAVLRFLELGYPDYKVFGQDLNMVVCNPFLTCMARFEVALGVPDVLENCIVYLLNHLDTPGLFQVHLSNEHVMELRDTIEEVGYFQQKMALDVHQVSAIMYQYLWELTEPLIPQETLASFRAGFCAEDSASRLEHMNVLKLLVNKLPWHSKPLVQRLFQLLSSALDPIHSKRNGLTEFAVAHCFAPLLIRDPHEFPLEEYEDAELRRYAIGYQTPQSVRFRLMQLRDSIANGDMEIEAEKEQSKDNVAILSFLIREHAYVLEDFIREIQKRRRSLHSKIRAMESFRFQLEETVDASNPEHLLLIQRLHAALSEEPGKCSACESPESLLSSTIWKDNGFDMKNPLLAFRGGNLLALKCIIYFIETYPDKAKEMMTRNALPGGDRYPFPTASINVIRMMIQLLMLDAAPNVSTVLLLHGLSSEAEKPESDVNLHLCVAERVSRSPFWALFNDPNAFFKLYSMAFILLDIHWIHSGATQMGFQPVLDATRQQMGWLLEQAPLRVEDMWKKWVQVREERGDETITMFLSPERSAGCVV